jgi:hypothetical protein
MYPHNQLLHILWKARVHIVIALLLQLLCAYTFKYIKEIVYTGWKVFHMQWHWGPSSGSPKALPAIQWVSTRMPLAKNTYNTASVMYPFLDLFDLYFQYLLPDCFINHHIYQQFFSYFSLMFVFVILTHSMYLCLCSKVVKFSVRELSDVKRVSSHHLRLLGFKPLDCLKDYHNLRPSTFIYPSDEVTIHSILINSLPRILCHFAHNLHVFFQTI